MKQMNNFVLGLSVRERKFINNFMMSKQGNDFIDNLNWLQDCQMYGFKNLKTQFHFFSRYISENGYLSEEALIDA